MRCEITLINAGTEAAVPYSDGYHYDLINSYVFTSSRVTVVEGQNAGIDGGGYIYYPQLGAGESQTLVLEINVVDTHTYIVDVDDDNAGGECSEDDNTFDLTVSQPSPPSPPPLPPNSAVMSLSMFAGDFWSSDYGINLFDENGNVLYGYQNPEQQGSGSECTCCIYPDYGFESWTMFTDYPDNTTPDPEFWTNLLSDASYYSSTSECIKHADVYPHGIYGLQTTDVFGDGYSLDRFGVGDIGMWNISSGETSLQLSMITDPMIYLPDDMGDLTRFGIPAEIVHQNQDSQYSLEYNAAGNVISGNFKSKLWCIELDETGVSLLLDDAGVPTCPSSISTSAARLKHKKRRGVQKKKLPLPATPRRKSTTKNAAGAHSNTQTST